jgi:formylglycine-generating enzyme required for sulfatase activity
MLGRQRLVGAIAIVTILVTDGRDGSERPVTARRYGPASVDTIPGTNVSFRMAYVPAGTFVLGSPVNEEGRDPDEGPQRVVRLDAFWIGVQEVRNEEYAIFRDPHLDTDVSAVAGHRFDVDAVTRPSPPYEDPSHGMSHQGYPATGMTQWAALQYARWLSFKMGRLYRLPTEAEWEYACRAGTAGPYPFASDAETLAEHVWFVATSGEAFHPAGVKRPNPWGLYDMLGNVAEWTLDQYDATAYESLADTVHAPWRRPTAERPRVVRGGAFDDDAAHVRCAERLTSTLRWKRRDPQLPKSRWWNTDSPHVGFRLVREDRAMTLDEIRAFWDGLQNGDS